jgi:hypothetical protein
MSQDDYRYAVPDSKNKKEILYTGNETPLVILKKKRKTLLFGFLILIILIFYSIFGVILPVLKTGDYNSVYCLGGIVKKILMFYASCFILLWLPYLIISLLRNAGTYFFYNDRVELNAYWIKRKAVIPYNRMRVIRKSSGRGGVMWMVDTMYNVNSIMSHPLLFFKFRYWNGIRFATFFSDQKIAGLKAGLTMAWENPEDGLKALQILKEKALSYEEK